MRTLLPPRQSPSHRIREKNSPHQVPIRLTWWILSLCLGLGALATASLAASAPVSQEGHQDFISKREAVEFLLATARAARTTYVHGIVEMVKAYQIAPHEHWNRPQPDRKAIMLPAQFLKAVGEEVQDFELTLVGPYPVNTCNQLQTKAEREKFNELVSSNKRVITFWDGNVFKGMSADRAIVKGCVDCHNKPAYLEKSRRRQPWKINDVMGAIIVRLQPRTSPTDC